MRLGHRHFRLAPRVTIRYRGWLLCAGALTLLFLPWGMRAQANKPTEFEVKAAYLFNFGKFVKWPVSAGSGRDTFSICVLGSDPFGAVLDSTVSGEQIDGKKVIVRRVNAAPEATSCRILFVGKSEEARLSSIVSTLGRSPVLTVSDISGFADHEGMIQFVMDSDRVRFQVNLAATQKAGLTLSSELLKVATAIKGQSGE